MLIQYFVDMHPGFWSGDKDMILGGLEQKFKGYWEYPEWDGNGN